MKQGLGKWVDGADFWNRDAELQLFIERADAGAHQRLVAQRRMGKTSLMREAARRVKDRYTCVHVDWQKAQDAADAIAELSVAAMRHASLWQKAKEVYGNILKAGSDRVEGIELGELGIKLRAGLTSGGWPAKGDQLFGVLAQAEPPVLLLLDEVPLVVNRILKGGDNTISPERRQEADRFMCWLRDNSLRHQGKVRMVITGSIGLEPILGQAGLSSTINNFVPLDLPPWDRETAVGCLEALATAYGIDLEQGVAGAMAEQLGCCIPHHVQMFFAHVQEHCVRRKTKTVATGDIEGIYRHGMLGTRGHVELKHYEERLSMVLDEQALVLAIDLLSEAAVCGRLRPASLKAASQLFVFETRTTEDVIRLVLEVLEHDGYLVRDGQDWTFVSSLLCDWWKARYGYSFTPLGERD